MSAAASAKARAVVYDRVSEADPESQAEHLRRCRAFAKARGWRVVAEETDTASGFSRSAKRPGWDRVVAMVEAQEVDVVVVFAVSRAGRNLARFAAFVELCREHGVTFASATEPIDTSGEFGLVFLALLSALAQMESATKRERALVGEATHKRYGTYRGGNIGFGWRVDAERRIVVDDTEAALIRQAATDVLNGTSLEAIAKRWNDANVKTHPGNGRTVGGRWSGSHVRAVLTSERNAPAILTASDRRRLVKLADSRRTGKAPDRYLLSGLCFSATDGHRLVGRQAKYVDWRPTERPRVRLSVRSHLLDTHVWEAVNEHALSRPFEPTEARDPSDDLVAERERLIAELEALGESDLSEHVIRGRERKLMRGLETVEAQLDKAKPATGGTFWDTFDPSQVDPAVVIRQHVRRVLVAPATTTRWDASRVRIDWR